MAVAYWWVIQQRDNGRRHFLKMGNTASIQPGSLSFITLSNWACDLNIQNLIFPTYLITAFNNISTLPPFKINSCRFMEFSNEILLWESIQFRSHIEKLVWNNRVWISMLILHSVNTHYTPLSFISWNSKAWTVLRSWIEAAEGRRLCLRYFQNGSSCFPYTMLTQHRIQSLFVYCHITYPPGFLYWMPFCLKLYNSTQGS